MELHGFVCMLNPQVVKNEQLKTIFSTFSDSHHFSIVYEILKKRIFNKVVFKLFFASECDAHKVRL